jgi:hypothetical protein
MNQEEQLLEQVVVRLNAKLMGIILGCILGAGLFLATNILVLKGGPVTGPHLGLLSQFFPGYRVTFLGSFIGFFYAFGTGFIIGSALGAIYNRLAHV